MFDSHIRQIHTYHAMVCVNQTRPHCVNQMGKKQSKPLAERHGMCESALTRHIQLVLRTHAFLPFDVSEVIEVVVEVKSLHHNSSLGCLGQ
jgi:hypothetical protein